MVYKFAVLPDATLPQREHGTPLAGLAVSVLDGPDRGRRVVASQTLSIGVALANDLVLTDNTVSRHHLELIRNGDRIIVRDHGSTNGTFFSGAAIREIELVGGGRLRLGNTTIHVSDGDPAIVEAHGEQQLAGLHGSTTAMRQLMARVQRVAASDVSVLVLGETGSGKEVVAHAIHELSPRSGGPLETIDCGAMTPSLIASELFGHEQGAFTGAVKQHAGVFERADGGTVFLDEIGELPAELQTALLGALERRTVRRLGGKAMIPFDVRLVAATNRDLRAEVNRGTFRQDLYYRIAVVLMRIPPLRERVDDIPLLAEHFLRMTGYDGASSQVLTPAVIAELKTHLWPGNVRELRNAIEAMIALDEPFVSEGRPSAAAQPPPAALVDPEDFAFAAGRERAIDHFESTFLKNILAHTRGNVSEAARVARIHRSYMIKLIAKHGVKFRRETV